MDILLLTTSLASAGSVVLIMVLRLFLNPKVGTHLHFYASRHSIELFMKITVRLISR